MPKGEHSSQFFKHSATTENNKFNVNMKLLGLKCAAQIVLPFLLLNTNFTCKHFLIRSELFAMQLLLSVTPEGTNIQQSLKN